MEKDIKVQNLQSYCRTCLTDFEGCKYDVEQLPKPIFQIFKQVTGFPKKHNELFPKWICDSCRNKINTFSEFRIMSKKSTEFLENLVRSYSSQKLVNGFAIEEQNDPVQEASIQELESFLNEENKKERGIEVHENLQEKCNFENIFLHTEIKDQLRVVRQFPNCTDDLSPINAAQSNKNDIKTCNIKVETECNSEDNNEDTTCKVCNLTCSSVALLNSHMNIHENQRPFRCENCNNDFKTKTHFMEHMEDIHADMKIVGKYNCGETFSQNKLVLSHYKNKHCHDGKRECAHNNSAQPDYDIQSNSSSDDDLNLLAKYKKYLDKKTCKICNKIFACTSTLRTHMRSHEECHRFQCDHCHRGFKRKHRLTEHIREMHVAYPLEINCKFGCGRTFLRSQSAISHIKSKHSSKVDIDVEPNQKIEKRPVDPSKLDAATDMFSVVYNTTCKICFNNYSSEQKLKVHMRLHEEKRPFQCVQCERSFNEKARLQRHITENHSTGFTKIDCEFGCGKIFRHLETAKKHYYLKHSPAEKRTKPKTYTFMCENCGRIFKNITTLREHSYTHLPVEDRPYKCEECSKSFTSKRSYRDHLTRHSGVKKFECPHCGLKKTTRKELKFHLNIHTKEKVFSCSVCAKVFNRLSGLKLHQRVVHQGIKQYNCSYCDQAFGKPDTLKHHEMRHTGERPHKCQNCDRSFIQVVALRAHMKTHNK